MKLIFLGNNLPLSLVVKTFSFSSWHHVGVLVDKNVYEATTKGVVKTSIHDFKRRGKWAIVDVPCPDPEKGVQWMESQLGRAYDWAGIWGLISRDRDWQQNNKWYCSEFAAMAFKKAGITLVRDTLRGVTPRDEWVLPYPVIDRGVG